MPVTGPRPSVCNRTELLLNKVQSMWGAFFKRPSVCLHRANFNSQCVFCFILYQTTCDMPQGVLKDVQYPLQASA